MRDPLQGFAQARWLAAKIPGWVQRAGRAETTVRIAAVRGDEPPPAVITKRKCNSDNNDKCDNEPADGDTSSVREDCVSD